MWHDRTKCQDNDMCRKKGTDKYIKNKEDKDMSKLHDKRVRLLMVKRYLNAETSIDEERELSEFYTTTTEKLTSEDEDVQLLLQATSTTDENFQLSKSKVAEFDRMMASLPCQRTHVPERLRVGDRRSGARATVAKR